VYGTWSRQYHPRTRGRQAKTKLRFPASDEPAAEKLGWAGATRRGWGLGRPPGLDEVARPTPAVWRVEARRGELVDPSSSPREDRARRCSFFVLLSACRTISITSLARAQANPPLSGGRASRAAVAGGRLAKLHLARLSKPVDRHAAQHLPPQYGDRAGVFAKRSTGARRRAC